MRVGWAQTVDFQRDVQPILAEYCTALSRRGRGHAGGLRLDVRESALAAATPDPAIVPGKPEESELIRRVTCEDDDEVMPPAEQNKRLSAAQVEVLKQWISEGANYAAHWAFVAPEQAAVAEAGADPPH